MSNYDHTPRPEIEQHYHIKELIEGQEKRTEDREYHRAIAKERAERDDLIKDSKPVAMTEFYCDICKQDFKGQAVRQIEVDWSNSTQRIAFYKNKCDKGHWCQRLITDKHRDAFWSKSKLVALDRGNHSNDLLQSYQTGHALLYGKKS